MLSSKNNKGINECPLFPTIECSCGLPHRTKVSAFPEYKRSNHEEKFSPSAIYCAACNNNGSQIISYKPDEILLRLDDQKMNSPFKKSHIPLPQGYFCSGVIQFCSKEKHFRTISSEKPWEARIKDNFQFTKVNSEEKKAQIDNPLWSNYIILAKRLDKIPSD